jgi:hypothetical protein
MLKIELISFGFLIDISAFHNQVHHGDTEKKVNNRNDGILDGWNNDQTSSSNFSQHSNIPTFDLSRSLFLRVLCISVVKNLSWTRGIGCSRGYLLPLKDGMIILVQEVNKASFPRLPGEKGG